MSSKAPPGRRNSAAGRGTAQSRPSYIPRGALGSSGKALASYEEMEEKVNHSFDQSDDDDEVMYRQQSNVISSTKSSGGYSDDPLPSRGIEFGGPSAAIPPPPLRLGARKKSARVRAGPPSPNPTPDPPAPPSNRRASTARATSHGATEDFGYGDLGNSNKEEVVIGQNPTLALTPAPSPKPALRNSIFKSFASRGDSSKKPAAPQEPRTPIADAPARRASLLGRILSFKKSPAAPDCALSPLDDGSKQMSSAASPDSSSRGAPPGAPQGLIFSNDHTDDDHEDRGLQGTLYRMNERYDSGEALDEPQFIECTVALCQRRLFFLPLEAMAAHLSAGKGSGKVGAHYRNTANAQHTTTPFYNYDCDDNRNAKIARQRRWRHFLGARCSSSMSSSMSSSTPASKR